MSTVYEFPISGDCIDITIEIGSSGEEHADPELIFPSDDDADDIANAAVTMQCSSHQIWNKTGLLYPANLTIRKQTFNKTSQTLVTHWSVSPSCRNNMDIMDYSVVFDQGRIDSLRGEEGMQLCTRAKFKRG